MNYGFVRELIRRDYTIIEVPVEEYWDLALNGVTLAPGQGDHERRLAHRGQGAREPRRRGDQVDFSESHKFAIAGLHCATLELVRDQPSEAG